VIDKFAVARALREIGLYLELKGENRFRARAYETGARAVEELREELGTLVDEERLTSVAGIGPALAATIAEIWSTGRSQQLEKLQKELPPGVLELAEVPGLSLKKIQQLSTALGIDSVDALKRACAAGRLAEVKGFGEKTQQKILEGIERWERRDERVRLVDAVDDAEAIRAYLAAHPACKRVEIAGSLRRWRETVSDADFLVASDEPAELINRLINYPAATRVVVQEERKAIVRLSNGLHVELHVVPDADFAAALVRLTGSPAHVARLEAIARVQEKVKVRLLRGTESDILEDGALDYPDAVLEKFDVVIASIHSRMKMDEEAMTRRLVNAMRQPVFKIWGHALGRLILRRDPFACRVDEVLDVIAESRAAIEINGDPYRLDLAPEHAQAARARGIKFVISTDAHSVGNLHNLRFGVHIARRGWIRRGEVLNALPADEFARAVRPA
jgi:DNA polymerase/3'-5' exonuclease PolX